MKLLLRNSNQNDLDKIYDLHMKCFLSPEHWYKTIIRQYLNDGIVIQLKDTNEIIGILLQGDITPCSKSDNNTEQFESICENGQVFINNNIHYKVLYGIVMLCIDPKYQKKGLGKKLVEKHFKMNKNKIVCLNTRKSNINAYSLYKKMGYEHIAYIKDKYFLPTEDSIFMIKDLNEA